MSTLLRGDLLNIESPKDDFTKVPNWLLKPLPKDITPVDRLLLMALYGYSHYKPDYKLPLTRLAEEVGLNKRNVIDRLKLLKSKNYLIKVYGRIEINVDKLRCGEHTLSKDSKVCFMQDQGVVGTPTKVWSAHEQGVVDHPIEEDKNEKKNEKKINSQNQSVGHTWFTNPNTEVLDKPQTVEVQLTKEDFNYENHFLDIITNPSTVFGMTFNKYYDYHPINELRQIPMEEREINPHFNKLKEVYSQVVSVISRLKSN